jgi:hypothetical protein
MKLNDNSRARKNIKRAQRRESYQVKEIGATVSGIPIPHHEDY